MNRDSRIGVTVSVGAVKHGPRNTQARSQDFSETPRHICGLADILRTRVRAGAWRSVSRVNYRYRRTKISLRPKFNRRPDLRRFQIRYFVYAVVAAENGRGTSGRRIGFKLFGREGKKEENGREMNTHGVSEARRFGACDALE